MKRDSFNLYRLYRIVLILAPLLYPGFVLAGEWTRVSPTTLALRGEIEKDDLERFLRIYKPTDRTLILNSTGGSMSPALSIGRILLKNPNLTTVVHEICASSCANYLFLAGRTKVLNHGIVGFHGNWKAMIESEKFKEQLASIKDFEKHVSLLAYHKQKVSEEAAFFGALGIDQELFDKTQKENDRGDYDIYLPGSAVFERYGIRDVFGKQDLAVLKQWPEITVKYDNQVTSGEPPPLPHLNQ